MSGFRVLHVVGSLDQRTGGPLRGVLDLSARAWKHGLASTIAGIGPVEIADNPLNSSLIHAFDQPSFWPATSRFATWLQANLRNYDSVVLHGLWSTQNWVASRECVRQNVPYACFPHGMLDLWSVYGQGLAKAAKKIAYWHWRERALVRNGRAVLFTTSRERERAQRTLRIPNDNQVIIPFGVEVESGNTPEPARAELMWLSNKPYALFLGRVHPKKGVDFLIRCWSEADLPTDWSLVIAGPVEPAYKTQLMSLVRRLRPTPKIHFVGPVAGASKRFLYQHAQWFCLPSKQENLGLVVLEAIQNGCPVAISDEVYIGDQLHDETEILPLDGTRWVEFLRTRMLDDDWRRHVIERDRSEIAPRFNIDVLAAQWANTLTYALQQ